MPWELNTAIAKSKKVRDRGMTWLFLEVPCVKGSMSDSLKPHGLQPTRLLRPWDFPGKSTGVGCRSLLQGISSTQGSNVGLPHYRQTLYHLSHQGSPHK